MELRATYRLQLGPDLDFAGARELVPYLRELGISHLYLSPSLQAAAGSTHGYDVIDPTSVSRELGGEEGLRELAAAGLGLVLDIVPNHMRRGEQNRWWRDPELRARFFDIDPQTGFARRFFDVDDLVGVRQEDPVVFETTHAKVIELLADGVLDGVRVDHPDGLADPAGYLRRLRDGGAELVWVEKILSATPPGEALRDWPVAGTVGYEFLNDAAALFVDPAGEGLLSELWAEVSADARPFPQVALEAKLEQAQTTFTREVDRLVRTAPRFDAAELALALASLPVYRTYVEPWSGLVEEADTAAVEASQADAALRDALLLRSGGGGGGNGDPRGELVVRFQQTSPAVIAKGVEDTACYRYLRLLALNEVGGDPARFGLTVEAFHEANRRRAARFPQGLLSTQTHDTKRSGDTRARIGAIAGLAGAWRERVIGWHALAAAVRAHPSAPDFADEYLLYQTLVGVWPIEWERLEAYLLKALREAKRHTSWVEPDHDYEQATTALARALIEHQPFREDFEAFLAQLLPEGERSALGQLMLKLCSPGIPDTYQGDELWRLSLVDPDNRRPVDWAAGAAALERVLAGGPPGREDRKLFLIHRALALRARRPQAFAGAYVPLAAGPEVCAFLRGEGEVLVAVALRGPLAGAEVTVELPEAALGRWRDVLGAGEAELAAPEASLAAFATPLPGIWLLERA